MMDRIRRIVSKGGPIEADFSELKEAINSMEKLSPEQETEVMELISPVLHIDTMQGHAFHKPYGYAGDFEIIDKIYTQWTSSDPLLKGWDDFFHSQEAPIAVRNRKKYFINLVTQIDKAVTPGTDKPLQILNIGSGPARDLKEFYDSRPGSSVKVDCVDMDKKAVSYATELCKDHIQKISFINKNIFMFETKKKYDLIWSAGLFDYLSDKQFIGLVNRLLGYMVDDGTLVIGNFSTNNPSRNYMEKFGAWFLNHRSEEDLFNLAVKAGADKTMIQVQQEEAGVNLFLHIKKT